MTLLSGIQQGQITHESIKELLTRKPRRMKLELEWPNVLHPPREEGKDWSIVLPFGETLTNAFQAGCPVHTTGFRSGQGRYYTFLPTAEEDSEIVEKVQTWVEKVGIYVAIRDCLALSFALDYDREKGDPSLSHSTVGALRVRAKPYDQDPTEDTYRAANALAVRLSRFVTAVEPYSKADAFVAMPPSTPEKRFDLPRFLIEKLASDLGKPNLSECIRTISARPPLKSEAVREKLAAISDSIYVAREAFDKKSVLLVDDLYQSGVSMNYVAMLLLNAGAANVFGLACVKTCRNDDNVGGRS